MYFIPRQYYLLAMETSVDILVGGHKSYSDVHIDSPLDVADTYISVLQGEKKVILCETGDLLSEVFDVHTLVATSKKWKCRVLNLGPGQGVCIPAGFPHAAVNTAHGPTVSLNSYHCAVEDLPKVLQGSARRMLSPTDTNISPLGNDIPNLIRFSLENFQSREDVQELGDDFMALMKAIEAFSDKSSQLSVKTKAEVKGLLNCELCRFLKSKFGT
eukprot:gene21889-28927_t